MQPFAVISIERTKELLNDPTLSDEEAAEFRDAFRALAGVIFETWLDNRSLATPAPLTEALDMPDRSLAPPVRPLPKNDIQ